MWWARYWEMTGGVGVFMRGAPCVPGGSENKIFARGVNFAPLAAEWAARGARADMPQRTRTVSTAYSLFILGSVRAKRVRYKNETFAGDTGALPALRGGRNYARSSAARDRELRQATDRAGRGQICRREPKRSLRHILYLYWGVSALSVSVIKTRRLRGNAGTLPTLRGGRNYVRSSATRDRELRRSGLRAGCRQKYAAENPNCLYGIFFISIGEYPRQACPL